MEAHDLAPREAQRRNDHAFSSARSQNRCPVR
jgi:hypothetical protein